MEMSQSKKFTILTLLTYLLCYLHSFSSELPCSTEEKLEGTLASDFVTNPNYCLSAGTLAEDSNLN